MNVCVCAQCVSALALIALYTERSLIASHHNTRFGLEYLKRQVITLVLVVT